MTCGGWNRRSPTWCPCTSTACARSCATGTVRRSSSAGPGGTNWSRALDLFRGEPLAGLPGPLAELERLRLVERRIALVRRKLEWQLRLGQEAEAIAELFALSAAHPLNEPLAAMLMRALHRGGRQADALMVFERARRRLADDLGVPPSGVLRRAHRMILRGDEAGPGPGPGLSAGTGAGP